MWPKTQISRLLNARSQDAGALVMLAAAQTIVWASLFYIFPILLVRWEAGFGWDRGDVAMAFSLSLIISAVASPQVGALIDRGHSRLVMPISAGLGGVLLIALSTVESRTAFYVIWALIGLAMAGCLYEPCFSFLTRVRGGAARPAITLVTLIAGFASAISYPVADALTIAYGWRTAVEVFGIVVLALGVPLFIFAIIKLEAGAIAAPPAPAAEQRAAAKAARRRPEFWYLAGAMPMVGLTHGMIISNIIPILTERGADQAGAVLAASLIGPMQVAGRLLITLGGRRLSAVALTLASFAGVFAGIAVLLTAAGADWRIFVFVALLGSSYGVISIAKPEVTASLLGREGFGAIAGMLAVPYIACVAVAPTLAVMLWRVGGYDLTLMVAAGSMAFAAILLRLAAR